MCLLPAQIFLFQLLSDCTELTSNNIDNIESNIEFCGRLAVISSANLSSRDKISHDVS